jgi:two-component system CheB/CheR fusion protein
MNSNEEAPEDGPPGLGFPVVGIGASAGGLGAFEGFFSGLPKDGDPGMAFVLVQHLAPDHESLLTELIQRQTRLPVQTIENGMAVKPNAVYIIPPNHDLAIHGGVLLLEEAPTVRGPRLAIDHFFSSLAQDQGKRAVAIVLAGTGSDGSLGIRAIKAAGGMVMAQTPASAEFDGMPRSALATGMVDFELPPPAMLAQLLPYARHAAGAPLPPPPAGSLDEASLKKLFELLRSRTGHDFSEYKPNSFLRRADRRMALHQIDSLSAYVQYIQQAPAEVDALFSDLLIGVTRFFRDPEAFQALELKVIPALFEGRPPDQAIRVWCPGCSTGEEAFSVAILLQERLEALGQSRKIQVFATDIDPRAIATARAGTFPENATQDLSPHRLARFFSPLPSAQSIIVNKGIRDLLIFSEQDLGKDPPFSKLDLICCRNLLIYMGASLQRRLMPLFHFALNPGGFLFLGSSESVGDSAELFNAVDRPAKIYARREDPHGDNRLALGRLMQAVGPRLPASRPSDGRNAAPAKPPLRELTEQALLNATGQMAALVNGHGDILYLHGRIGQYLEPAPGEAGINNILVMAREGLRRELTTALHKTVSGEPAAHALGLRVRVNGARTVVNLSIRTLPADAAKANGTPLYLVVLEEVAPAAPGADLEEEAATTDAASVAALRHELQAKDEFLQTTNEELRSSNEELRSSNEEMQSVNEELQSANEELETSKEELQSVNEELATVNSELQTKVADLSVVNNDMNNLLAGTGIATLFVDHQLRIVRFTPAATGIINLIPGDVNRPLSHIVSNLVGYDRLVEDVTQVLATLVPQEVQVGTKDGRSFTMRIQPYRTLDNVIEGAVITFVDVTEMKRATEALRVAQEALKATQARAKAKE